MVLNGLMFFQHGIKLVNDSARYIEYATNLHKGFYIDPYNIWYVGYPLVIYVFQLFGTGYGGLIGFQYLLGFVAALALYHASLNVWKNPLGAFLAGCLYIIFIDSAQWNSYVLTESIYVSFTCICLYLLSLLYAGKRGSWLYLITASAILFTFFVKPTGVALLGATFSAGLYISIKRLPNWWSRVIVIVVAGGLFLLLVNRMLRHYLIMENYQKGEIIYAVTLMPDHRGYDLLIVTPPSNAYVPPDHYPPILKIVAFIFHHPVYWTKLSLAKAFYFLAHVRPYWSAFHNIYSLLILLPCYFFFIRGLKKQTSTVLVFMVSFCLLHTLSICFTSEDWDGRFLIPMLPVIFLGCTGRIR